MRIMTFNTQHCKNFVTGEIDFARMAEVIRDARADVVGLNEMRGKGVHPEYDRQVPILSRLSLLPYHYFAKAVDLHGGVDPYGNGLLSRHPIISAQTIPIPYPPELAEKEPRCVLKARLSCGLTVLVTHFGLTPPEHALAVETILANLPAKNCVLMGDFNVTPNDPVLAPIRERMQDAADLFAEPLLSYPSDAPTVKIDYIFATPDIEILRADIPSIVASDHRPHTAKIKY